ncbi:ABC transporter ATP-binding protein [Lentilitoribacter sp. Alg239-R112]|uniref:ABC transporter ATP-binding protein n=1 Tax=Lentilitoribacter sp. Alg239-R112 TaxID=2305987 RepID=UPI0013A6A34C|nr:ABC transporter ATP-binding protein [Lentilitoribacter sp. Alg239-R112]
MLEIVSVSKNYAIRNGTVPVLKDVSSTINDGELCALTGTSGSGKTTLLNLIGSLDKPTNGTIKLNGIDITQLDTNDVAHVRNELIGFVFQSFHLLARLTAKDNVALPLIYRGIQKTKRRDLAFNALKKVGLHSFGERFPDELSGGQRQRVAIARALVGNPPLLLADEPTGNLDSRSANDIMSLFQAINKDAGVTILIVTHDPTIAARCPRRIVMRDGRIFDDNHDNLKQVAGLP